MAPSPRRKNNRCNYKDRNRALKENNFTNYASSSSILDTIKQIKISCLNRISNQTVILPKHYLDLNCDDEQDIFIGSFDRVVNILKEDIGFSPEKEVIVMPTSTGQILIKNERHLESAMYVVADHHEKGWYHGNRPSGYMRIEIIAVKSTETSFQRFLRQNYADLCQVNT